MEATINNLSAAVRTAKELGEYYATLPNSLAGINTELEKISSQIQGIVSELGRKTAQVEANDATIRDLTGRSDATTAELTSSREETQRIASESEGIKRQVTELTEQQARERSEKQSELEQLQAEHQANLKQQQEASSEEARRALAEKDALNVQEQQALRGEMDKDRQESQARFADLSERAKELQDQAAASQNEIGSLNATRQELAAKIQSLETENAELKRQIDLATEAMESATAILKNLKPENKDAIQRQIQTLQDHIQSINRILGSEPRDAEFADALESILPYNTIITKQYYSNGRTYEKRFTLGSLLTALDKATIRGKENVINKLRSADNLDKINTILDDLTEGQLASILDIVTESRGGRKTRRHKKRSRKTKNQRGGFKYSAHARRTSITTPSSSRRRSSRSSSSRSSSSRRRSSRRKTTRTSSR